MENQTNKNIELKGMIMNLLWGDSSELLTYTPSHSVINVGHMMELWPPRQLIAPDMAMCHPYCGPATIRSFGFFLQND